MELAENIAKKLRAMPPVEPKPRELSKQDMIKVLADEIKALQERGYTLEQIAESLSGEGLDIKTPTLKNYLYKTSSDRPRRKKRTRRSVSSSGASKAASLETTKPAPEQQVVTQPKSDPSKAQSKSSSKAKSHQKKGAKDTSGEGLFAIRPDSDDM